MENTDNLLPEYSAKPKFAQNGATEQEWLQTGKWAKFFGIYGFIYVGLNLIGIAYVIVSIWPALTNTRFALPPIMLWGFGLLFLMVLSSIVCVYFGSRYHLLFAQQIRSALNKRDPVELHNAWQQMKSVWKAFGVYAICMIVFYLLLTLTMGYII